MKTTDKRITFTHGRMQCCVQPANVQRVRDALFELDRAKPKKPKLGKVNDTNYPVFTPGMLTSYYVGEFLKMNVGNGTGEQRLKFTFAERAAPMLDPLVPEVIEEVDPDYVAPEKTKRAAPTVVSTLRAQVAALENQVNQLRQRIAEAGLDLA